MPIRLCADPACPNPAVYNGRCGEHAAVRNRETQSRFKHIYNSKRWQLTRRSQLFNHPLCACGEIATDVHHIRDLADGGDPFSFENLESDCHSCHSRISRQRQAQQTG